MRKEKLMLTAVCVLFAACVLPQTTGILAAEENDTWETACTTPFGRYPETVSYTLGKMVNMAYSGMPEGDTYENNAYTRYLEEKLNVKTELVLYTDSTTYEAAEKAAIISGTIPDIMVIDDYQLLKDLVENDMVEELTPYFDMCFSDRIHDMYDSYGEDRFSSVTFNGKIYAVPETDIYSSANFIWLRGDWMDQLGLEPPETLDDVEEIIRQFILQDPGGNGEGNTIGLLCDKQLIADTSNCFSVVPVFAAFGAYPDMWVPQEDGTMEYGSVLPETKEALACLRDWYTEGILDREFLLRTVRNNAKLIQEGKSGSFFGWWWAPNSPLEEAVRSNPEADWRPYLLSNDGEGGVNTYIPYAAEKYVVVRKGYEHPELVPKVISLLYDYARYEDRDAKEIEEYFTMGVDPSATPFVVNCDYSDAIERVTKQIQAVLAGEKERDELNTVEKGYYDACESWLSGTEYRSSDWAAYTSRITAVSLLLDTEVHYVNENYTHGFRDLIPKELKEYENEYMLKIIMGQKALSAFDEMVQQWYARGGSRATREAQKLCGNRSDEEF